MSNTKSRIQALIEEYQGEEGMHSSGQWLDEEDDWIEEWDQAF